MRASNGMKAGAAVAVAAIAVGIIGGAVVKVNEGPKKVHIAWGYGGPNAETKCMMVSAMADKAALQLFGLDVPADGFAYVRTRVCATPADGGAGPSLPPGLVAVPDTDDAEVPHQGGWHKLEAWRQGEATDPSPCACSPGDECEANVNGAWVAAPKLGNTIPAGAWRGAGCVRKTCVELAGYSSMPAECRP